MANYRQAPRLEFDKNKEQVCSTFDAIPSNVADAMFRQLGNKFRLYKIMHILIGTKPGFAISEKFICERAGLDESNYRKARKELIEMGWLTLLPSEMIKVNFSAILGEEPEPKKEPKIEESAAPPTQKFPIQSSIKPPFRERDETGGETEEEYALQKAGYYSGLW